ncbi:transglycosylase SLT domain-containing protein [Bartonella ancashensis]
MLVAILSPNVSAQNPFIPSIVPIPLPRPHVSTTTVKNLKKPSKPARNEKISPDTTKNIIVSNQLKSGLNALANNNVIQAIALRDVMATNSLDRQILTWAIGVSNNPKTPSAELFNTINELKEWPGITIIQRNAEYSFASETHSAQKVIQFFSYNPPITAQGMAAFIKALVSTGKTSRARQIIAPWWHKTKLTAEEEKLILKETHSILKPIDHLKRMKIMLYANRINSAERVAVLAQAQSLFKAFAAVEKNDPRAAQKLKAVDQSWQKDPLLQFAQIRYLRRTGQYNAAATLMMRAPQDTENLVDPHAWWIERRAISREMLDLNKPQIAYQLVAHDTGAEPSSKIDAAFHAGWYALQFLRDPKLAMQHFTHIPKLSSTPFHTSRGYYWIGRAAEKLGNHQDALNYFHRAAHFKTTYYGQLANSKLKRTKLTISFPKPTPEERQRFSARKSVQAIKKLEKIGQTHLAKILYSELSKMIKSRGELALLAVMAEKKGDYYTSLKIGKTPVPQDNDIDALSYPIGAIPSSVNISTTKKALVYAIARQESEFNPKAVSKAGAQGMLQLLPTTAKELANKHSIPWSQQKLANDAGYSATLSAHFLDEQLKRFNGSFVLTLVSYNAGPRRANEWIERYGDPREQPIEKVIDWIERIPYIETRHYIMRVMENYGIYKMRLVGTMDIKTDLVSGHPGHLR